MQEIHSKTYKQELENQKNNSSRNLTLYQKRKDNQQKEVNEQTTTKIHKSKWVINLSTWTSLKIKGNYWKMEWTTQSHQQLY